MPLWPAILLYFAILNLLTWHVWRLDKKYAVMREKRVPERTLLTLCVFGGWPFALIGTQVFHHKSSKKAFIHKVYLVAGFQVAILCIMIALFWLPM